MRLVFFSILRPFRRRRPLTVYHTRGRAASLSSPNVENVEKLHVPGGRRGGGDITTPVLQQQTQPKPLFFIRKVAFTIAINRGCKSIISHYVSERKDWNVFFWVVS
jgi:hypothetical protein